ncbi:MAG: hypothetical protein ABIJ18_05065 [archaeon]
MGLIGLINNYRILRDFGGRGLVLDNYQTDELRKKGYVEPSLATVPNGPLWESDGKFVTFEHLTISEKGSGFLRRWKFLDYLL